MFRLLKKKKEKKSCPGCLSLKLVKKNKAVMVCVMFLFKCTVASKFAEWPNSTEMPSLALDFATTALVPPKSAMLTF